MLCGEAWENGNLPSFQKLRLASTGKQYNGRNSEIDYLFRYLNRWSASRSSCLSTLQRSRAQNSREFSCVLSFLFLLLIPNVQSSYRRALHRREGCWELRKAAMVQ